MSTTESRSVTTQVYRVYIRATPEAIWDAITKPEWTDRYGYGGGVEYDLRPGGAYKALASDEMKKAGAEMGFPTPDVVVDGEVIEADPPRRLIQTWRLLMDPEMAAEGFTRLTYEIEPMGESVTRLTLIHELDGAPKLAVLVSGEGPATPAEGGGGWPWVLSDLKSLLETGGPMASSA
jgi:uncharacterized protein YndB with AHSA1/START domain